MDVIIDKVNSGDDHSLTMKDVKSIHKFVAAQFDFKAKTYRLSSEHPDKSRFDRPVKYDMIARKLIICSRGLSKKDIIKEIFVEVLQETDSSLRAASFNHLSNEQSKRAYTQADTIYKEYISYVSSSEV